MPEELENAGQPAVAPPLTPEERRKRKFETLHLETDEQRSKRRHGEIHSHLDAHLVHIAEAHAMYPAPVAQITEENQHVFTKEVMENWNARRKLIDSANRAYHLAVKRTFAEHQAEDAHLAKLRAAANKGAE